MTKNFPLTPALFLCISLSSLSAFADSGIINLGTLGGATANAYGVNSDGSVVVGMTTNAFNETRAFRWTQAGGLQDLGTLGGSFSFANGVNNDGSVVVGQASNAALQNRAFRWTQGGGLQDLDTLGGATANAYGVNSDGSVVVGQAQNAAFQNRAFRWTQAGGMQDLGTLGGTTSTARHINSDGSVVVGQARNAAFRDRAFRWTQAGGMQDLGTFGGTISIAHGVNSDGSVVVGGAQNAANQYRAFRWTQAGGLQDLGILLGGTISVANGVNSDGSVVVGQATNAVNQYRAFRWTQAGGMQTVEEWLRDNGVTVPTDITFSARGVNSDGSVVVGQLANNQAFIARLAPKNVTHIGSGIIGLKDTFESLATITPAPVLAAEASELVLNGIHGHPLSSRIQNGHNSFWLAGDWGAERKIRDGIAEVGLSKKVISNWQAGLGLGRTLRRQRLDFNGRQNFNGLYTLAEILGELPLKNLWLTLNGFFHWGDLENRRGYINAGMLDKSCGRSESFSKSFRARLDWDKFLAIKNFSFTPYGQYAVSFAKQTGYTETGGGFPAFFNAKKQHVQEARMGVNGELALTKNISFLSTIEGVHRFEKRGSNTSGHLLELVGFDIPGRKYKQDWLRGSIGLQGPIGQGLAMLNLNATTVGEDTRMWLGASYHLNF